MLNDVRVEGCPGNIKAQQDNSHTLLETINQQGKKKKWFVPGQLSMSSSQMLCPFQTYSG